MNEKMLDVLIGIECKLEKIGAQLQFLYACENCKKCEWFDKNHCLNPESELNVFSHASMIEDCERWENE